MTYLSMWWSVVCNECHALRKEHGGWGDAATSGGKCFAKGDYFMTTEALFSPRHATDEKWLIDCGCPLADQLRDTFVQHVLAVDQEVAFAMDHHAQTAFYVFILSLEMF